MSCPYLLEVRLFGQIKKRLKAMMRDVAERFGVRGAVDPRPVPHMTLFGPYGTNRGEEVKETLLSLLTDFEVVPYRIDGFGAFREQGIVYADVVPSPTLRDLRREISRRLRPLATEYPSYDRDYFYEFHITIASGAAVKQVDDILGYVRDQYELQTNEYAPRMTNLVGRDIMWEYDLLCDKKYSSEVARSSETVQKTERCLEGAATESDHDSLEPMPGQARRVLHRVSAKMTGDW